MRQRWTEYDPPSTIDDDAEPDEAGDSDTAWPPMPVEADVLLDLLFEHFAGARPGSWAAVVSAFCALNRVVLADFESNEVEPS